jgi:hypothetical protein
MRPTGNQNDEEIEVSSGRMSQNSDAAITSVQKPDLTKQTKDITVSNS